MQRSVESNVVLKRMPRVCILTETFYPVVGGGETHARLLAERLNKSGVKTFVLTRRSSRKYGRTGEIDGTQIYRTPPCGMKRFGKYLMVPFVLQQLFRLRNEYDVIFVCGYRILGIPAVIAAGILKKPCVLRAEGLGEMSGNYASAYKKLPLLVDQGFSAWIGCRNRVLKKADAFVSISKPVADEFLDSGISPEKVHLIPNGIDLNVFSPVDASKKSELRAQLKLPNNAFIAAYSGKLNQGKGLEHLLSAWKTLACKYDNIHLVLIGSGGGQSLSCEDDLRAFVKEHKLDDKVTFTGYVTNVCRYLQASDIFVFPSENEAQGIALIEAMACGLPSIASDTGGIPEIVQNGINGILVEPGCSDAITQSIEKIIDTPSLIEKLGSRARESVCSRYSMDSVASRYIELFGSLMPGISRQSQPADGLS